MFANHGASDAWGKNHNSVHLETIKGLGIINFLMPV